jgi:hypothetical protein
MRSDQGSIQRVARYTEPVIRDFRARRYRYFCAPFGVWRFSQISLDNMKLPEFDTLIRRIGYWYGRHHRRVIDRITRLWTYALIAALLAASVTVVLFFRWGPPQAMALTVLLLGSLAFYRHAYRQARLDGGHWISRTVQALLLLVAGWGLLWFGEAILALILAHPTYPVAFGLAWLTARLILGERSAEGLAGLGPQSIVRGGQPLFPMAARSIELSEHGLAINASHETGHMLLYAAWRTVKMYFRVQLRTEETDDWLGTVVGQVPELHVITEEHARRTMLLYLAGQAAEYYVHGQGSLGAGGDYDKWQHAARRYLRAGLGQARLIESPSNAADVAWNEEVLDKLHREQMDMLQTFFALNDAVVREIREALRRDGYMTNYDTVEYFNRVRFPERFPHPDTEPSYVLP